MDDYRDTAYCPGFEKTVEKKLEFLNKFREDHPRARDIHAYVSDNRGKYKLPFVRVYNGKCAYCGTSIEIIPKSMLEIDHFIPQTSSQFATKADAGHIENIVLSCHTCNHNKSDYELPDNLHDLLHPDHAGIKSVYYRDEMFYIKVADGQPEEVTHFYDQLQLGRETCRLDYLLLSMRGLYNKMSASSEAYSILGQAIEKLQKKRNITE